jgi:tetratricopeptide (TPR) repeat protein
VVTRAQSLAKTGPKDQATSCAFSAASAVADVMAARAHALYLLAKPKEALEGYAQALAVVEGHSASLYGRAHVLYETAPDDVRALKQASDALARFLAVSPGDGRAEHAKALRERLDHAVAAGGLTKLQATLADERKQKLAELGKGGGAQAASGAGGGPMLPPVSKEVAESIQNTERTPELEQRLDQLMDEGEEHLAKARFDEALISYRGVLPFRPQDGRAQAGMAWALIGLKKPMAERVWTVAMGNPAAVDKLGEALQKKGDVAGAKALWSRLSQSNPAYAQQAKLAEKLK